MPTTIHIKAFIDSRPISASQWILVALCCLVVFADGMDVAIMGFVAPSILADWGVSRPEFGLVMSAAPFGLVVGALIAGPSSDRFGRKPVLIASVFIFAVFTLAASFANSVTTLGLLRFLAGAGMGAAMPQTSTLLSEYAPQPRRSLLITIMFTGFNLGSAAIGFVAAYLIPLFGWRAVLVFGGVVPLALVPVLILLLPESARLLALRGAPSKVVSRHLGRAVGARFTGDEHFASETNSQTYRQPVSTLFSNGYSVTTIGLWVTYFMGLMVIYLLTGWLPTLMKDAGLSISTAANVTALFQVGGTIGAILVGWAMDRSRPARIISLAYVLGGVSIIGLAGTGALSPALGAIVFAAGFCMSGAQTGLNAFAPGCYPTSARATGVSWMLGIGRFGSILGSYVGGALLGLGWSFAAILGLLAIPAGLAAVAILSASNRRADAAEVADA